MLIQIPIEKVEPGMIVEQDVLSAKEGILIAKRGTMLSKLIIKKLREHGAASVLIDVTDAYLERYSLSDISKKPAKTARIYVADDRRTPADKKAEDGEPKAIIPIPDIEPIMDEKLRDEALSSIRSMFSLANESNTAENMTTAYQAIKEIDNVIDELVDTLSSESDSLVHIADLKSYDEYTYHHSLSVAVLSIAIGQSLGMPENEIRLLGRCAMLHDIGKMFIPSELINKPTKLSPEEFEVIKKHPLYGYDCLTKWDIGDMELRLGVLLHHEKMDGTGYPGKISGKDLPLWGRIISVADVYDAVTSYRSYRLPMSPAEALEMIMSQVGSAFDYTIVQAFIDKLELYPINTCVELSNGRQGIVKYNTFPMRPVLQMLDNAETIDLMSLDHLNLVITKIIEKN